MHAIDPLYSVCGFVGGLLVGMTGVGGGSLMIGVSGIGLSAVATGAAVGVSAIALRPAVRFGAARFPLVALTRPRVTFFTGSDLPRRVAVLRRAGAVLRFVADPRLPAFLVRVVFAFALDFRAVLAMAPPSLVG